MKILLFILAIHLAFLCAAQSQPRSQLRFNHLFLKDGLPEGQVNDLLQDREGYIWIATQRGLVRYDGYTPKVYYLGIKDPYAIDISSIFEDSKGRLWAGVTNGLYLYDRAGDRFIPIPYAPIKKICSFTEDKAGNLWLISGDFKDSSNKLIRLHPATKNVVSFSMEEKGKRHINAALFTDVFEDKAHRIWVSSNNGLYEYNAQAETFTPHFAIADSSKQI